MHKGLSRKRSNFSNYLSQKCAFEWTSTETEGWIEYRTMRHSMYVLTSKTIFFLFDMSPSMTPTSLPGPEEGL